MSGICGLFAFDGATPTLGPILDQLERRGPDATRSWSDGPVALGHTLLATTPEALVEQLPLTDAPSGCTITADVRLDNREQLIAALGLGDETRMFGDGELILRAYLHWAEDCPKHLLGDFAFAIWDPSQQRLFCARDHMGMRQVNYHHAPGRLFAFATNAEALVEHPDVPKTVSEARLADFLDDLEGIDFTSTFFEKVMRLAPAHSLTADAAGLSIRRYWLLRPGPALKLDSDQAYADAFLKVFTEAVRCRLRSAGPVGSMLSGGMDSGSVAAVAARLLNDAKMTPLMTFSAIGPDAEHCVETRTIHAATTAIASIDAHYVDHTACDSLTDELQVMPRGTEPFDLSMTLIRAIYGSAHRAGVKVMLDGVGGDIVLTPGNRASQLFRRGNVLAGLREIRGEAHFWGADWPTSTVLAKALWNAFVPESVRSFRRRLYTQKQVRRGHDGGLINPAFAARIKLDARREQTRGHSPGGMLAEPAQRAKTIVHPNLVVARERYDRVAAAVAIEPRDPFLDLRVIDFCLSLPGDQLQANGWPKIILRRAAAGLLPQSVIWRRGKEHLGWTFTKSLFSSWNGWSKRLDTSAERLAPYVSNVANRPRNQGPGKALDMETRIRLSLLLDWIERVEAPDPGTES